MPPNNNTPTAGPFEQVVERLKGANNVLITVSADPSLDQLASCIGLAIVLNKLGKHATAVFSGKTPSAIEFLKPEKTLEKNTDSLRDFIISLDKAKADKLRYKVEDNVVKIFITPYKTSITEKDLEFGQGDFNVDVVVAIGVKERSHLDAAIAAHGRILHDATVICINTQAKSGFAAIDWVEPRASSLSEMVSDIAVQLKRDVLDSQIATALLTGVVAETDRFRNEKVSPHTMSVSGVLMAAGASTQLVATKLEEAKKAEQIAKESAEKAAHEQKATPDGTIKIKHGDEPELEEETKTPPIQEEPEVDPADKDNIHIDDQGKLHPLADDRTYLEEQSEPDKSEDAQISSTGMILDPPQLGSQLTANSLPQDQVYSGSTDPLSAAKNDQLPLLGRKQNKDSVSNGPTGSKTDDNQTLSEIESKVDSPHLDVDKAREVADAAAEATDVTSKPREAAGTEDIALGDSDNYQDAESQKPTGPPPPGPPPMMPPSV